MRAIKGFHLLLIRAKSIAMQEGLIRALIYQAADRTPRLPFKHSISPLYGTLLINILNLQTPFRQPKERNAKGSSGTSCPGQVSRFPQVRGRIWKPQL